MTWLGNVTTTPCRAGIRKIAAGGRSLEWVIVPAGHRRRGGLRQECRSGPGKATVTTAPQVLVIDGLSETATVLQAILEPRGTVVQRTRTQRLPGRWEAETPPDVVVVDMDGVSAAEPAAVWGSTPHVVISSRRVEVADGNNRFLQKPFQFPELIRAVEDLLATPASTD